MRRALVMTREGGYCGLHMPFCGHAVMAGLAKSSSAASCGAAIIAARQPDTRRANHVSARLDEPAVHFKDQP